jgi:hypothetical protein
LILPYDYPEDKMSINTLVQIIDKLEKNSKVVSEVTTITKEILAKNPRALENNLAEQVIKSHLGESMYDKIQKIYQNIIGT